MQTCGPVVFQIVENRGENWGDCLFTWNFHLAQQKVGLKQQLLADIGEEVCYLCRAGKQLQLDLVKSTETDMKKPFFSLSFANINLYICL